mgnify:CR=1 FL=1
MEFLKKQTLFIFTHILGMFDDECPWYIRLVTSSIVIAILIYPAILLVRLIPFQQLVITRGTQQKPVYQEYIFDSQPVYRTIP